MNIIKNDQSLLTTKDSTNSSNFEELMTKAKVNEILDYNGEKNNITLLGQIEKEFFILRLKKIFYEKSDTEIWTKHIKLINSPKSIITIFIRSILQLIIFQIKIYLNLFTLPPKRLLKKIELKRILFSKKLMRFILTNI